MREPSPRGDASALTAALASDWCDGRAPENAEPVRMCCAPLRAAVSDTDFGIDDGADAKVAAAAAAGGGGGEAATVAGAGAGAD